MNALEEYGKRKYEKGKEKGRKEIIKTLHKTGMKPEEIAEITKKDINRRNII